MEKWKLYSLKVIVLSAVIAAIYLFLYPVKTAASYTVMASIYMWTPGIVAIALTLKEKRSLREIGLKLNFNKWYLFSWIVFPVVIALGIFINTLFPGASFNIYMSEFLSSYRPLLENSPDYSQMMALLENQPWIPLAMTVLSGMIAGITINFLFAIGEEIGWRGYLHDKLIHLGFWKTSGLIGLIWGVWHAPLILQGHNYPEYPVLGVFLMIIWCVLLSPIFTLLRIKSRSVLSAGIAHGTLNGLAGISIIYIDGGHPLLNGIIGLSGFLALLIANTVIWLILRKKPID